MYLRHVWKKKPENGVRLDEYLKKKYETEFTEYSRRTKNSFRWSIDV